MKRITFQFSILALVGFFLTSCAPDLEDINGNKIYLDNEYFEITNYNWRTPISGSAIVTLERAPSPTVNVIGPSIKCYFTLFNWPENSVPQVGTYTCSSHHPDSTDQAFLAGVGRYESYFQQSLFLADTTQVNTFEITSVYGNSFSGKVSCHLYDTEDPDRKKWLKASFENVLYQ